MAQSLSKGWLRMSTWIVATLVILLIAGLALYLPTRWGRGALGGSFRKPENEIQTTTPWKGFPTF